LEEPVIISRIEPLVEVADIDVEPEPPRGPSVPLKDWVEVCIEVADIEEETEPPRGSSVPLTEAMDEEERSVEVCMSVVGELKSDRPPADEEVGEEGADCEVVIEKLGTEELNGGVDVGEAEGKVDPPIGLIELERKVEVDGKPGDNWLGEEASVEIEVDELAIREVGVFAGDDDGLDNGDVLKEGLGEDVAEDNKLDDDDGDSSTVLGRVLVAG
jgi:hypothetical protein